MSKKLRAMLPYLAVIVAAFYLLPLLMRDTGLAMTIMLVALPLILLGASWIYGYRHGFNALFALFTAILFLPAVFIYMNTSALVYVPIYGLSALAGNVAGMLHHKWIKK